MGGDTALHLAADLPHLTRAIFVEDPPIILPGEKFGRMKQTMDPKSILNPGKVLP